MKFFNIKKSQKTILNQVQKFEKNTKKQAKKIAKHKFFRGWNWQFIGAAAVVIILLTGVAALADDKNDKINERDRDREVLSAEEINEATPVMLGLASMYIGKKMAEQETGSHKDPQQERSEEQGRYINK